LGDKLLRKDCIDRKNRAIFGFRTDHCCHAPFPVKPGKDNPLIGLRPPCEVMRLERMGAFHQTRLSFMRALLRFLKKGNWQFERTRWDIDLRGVGTAIYQASGPDRMYSLICFANDLPDEKRSDRVIAEEWDATFVLFDGVPAKEEVKRLKKNVPKQEAGHYAQTELVLSRANRSVRLFEHVVDSLSVGRQPDREKMEAVGYLMRTTAVYGNGKFGISDRERIAHRPEFTGPFRAELLSVWLIRAFTVDIAEHLATVRGGSRATRMDARIRRRLGVGNATGLGMAPFLVLHPALIHAWIQARETALARVRNIERSSSEIIRGFSLLLSRAMLGVESWGTADPRQHKRIGKLKQDLVQLAAYVKNPGLGMPYPWNSLVDWSVGNLSLEGQELAVTLVIEPHQDLVDDLAEGMSIDESRYFRINGAQAISDALGFIRETYPWALDIDFSDPASMARFWYVSEEKLEPRLGERFDEPGAEKEHPLAYARDIARLYKDLMAFQQDNPDGPVMAQFLLACPEHRHAVRRIQVVRRLPYAEIRDNLISQGMMPIDLLRCKLSFFGASKFDPKSDRWVRINMYQHAPFPDEFSQMAEDDWVYPPLIPNPG